MRYRDWTLICAACWLLTIFAIPLLIHWTGMPLYWREPGGHMSNYRAQEIAWAILMPFLWGLGMLAIRITRRKP